MGQPRPAIFSLITVPAGGWVLDIDISVSAQYDTNVEATIAAGDYYMGPIDAESFIHQVATVLGAAIEAADAGTPTDPVSIYIDDDHKVNIKFHGERFKDASGDNDVRINWDAEDGASIAAVLGFDSSAADTSTGTDEPTFTGDYHHAYGWYADEDGVLAAFSPENHETWVGSQVRSISGAARTHQHGSHFGNEIRLQFMKRLKTWSADINYGAESTFPYQRNEPLQCWWNEAMQGIRFRFYPDYRRDTGAAGISEAASATSDHANCRFDTAILSKDPDEWQSKVLQVDSGWNGHRQIWTINDHFSTGTVVVTAATPQTEFDALTVHLFDQPYYEYVVDLDRMSMFSPQEIPAIDRYNIVIPVWKYVA